MIHRSASLASLIAGLLLATAAVAAGPPDFSGNWTLNTDKGQNLGMVKAVSEKVAVKQTPEKLTLDFSTTFMMKTSQRQVTYDLTGKSSVVNEGAMGDKAETLAKWDGSKLVVTWTSEGAVAGTKTVKTEIRTLSADGRTMTVRNERPGKDPMEMVYEKN
ncbi:MAG: hypothetical protein AMXMBFR45_03220 [Gammaproteobacteria bacterium]|nr:hypothetical protein [Gammaproteobacteria bacterium]MCL4778410.1 hypothetical protein [Gammaproteobacteria bacterium]MCQ3934080.1 hypothetical protein [Gammaproteobacteria bacterium]MDL1880823.1 hypothetical protein [Gammaproteobacteria bacterium PRO2]